jgi:hypothetical protein
MRSENWTYLVAGFIGAVRCQSATVARLRCKVSVVARKAMRVFLSDKLQKEEETRGSDEGM